MRVEHDQGVVHGGERDSHQEGLFLVHIQTGRVAGQSHAQYTALLWFLLCQGCRNCPQP
jgi:hypothetical protein